MEAKMASLVAAVFVVVALSSLTQVDATGYSQGNIISWVDPQVSSLLGVMWRYKNYGCACGTNMNGNPLDKIDCCCQTHNECYEKLISEGTCSHNPYDASYSFKKTKDQSGKRIIQCESHGDHCGHKACECDVEVAECFAENGSHYNSHHKSYKQSACEHTNTNTDICE